MKTTEFAPPAHLSPRAQSLWREIIPARGRSAGRLALVQTALEALDRADVAREAIAKEGLTATTKTTGTVHLHPLLRLERESRQLFAKIWDQMNLSWDNEIDGRFRP